MVAGWIRRFRPEPVRTCVRLVRWSVDEFGRSSAWLLLDLATTRSRSSRKCRVERSSVGVTETVRPVRRSRGRMYFVGASKSRSGTAICSAAIWATVTSRTSRREPGRCGSPAIASTARSLRRSGRRWRSRFRHDGRRRSQPRPEHRTSFRSATRLSAMRFYSTVQDANTSVGSFLQVGSPT